MRIDWTMLPEAVSLLQVVLKLMILYIFKKFQRIFQFYSVFVVLFVNLLFNLIIDNYKSYASDVFLFLFLFL